MPLYNYRCKKCKHEEERLESINAPETQDCSECNSKESLERYISGAPQFTLSGGGWYANGYQK